jgi:hypothetical protein
MDEAISRLLTIVAMDASQIITETERNNFLKLLFQANISMYEHRRDDIGFELGWLYYTLRPYIDNLMNPIDCLALCEHLETLRYFLRTTTR